MNPTMQSTSDSTYLLSHVANVLQRQSDQVLQERLGIGLSQYRILMMLEETASLSQRQIADSLGQTEASISRQVKLLHEKGMLVTAVDPGERRKHVTRPTAKGLKITQAAQETLDRFYMPVMDTFSPKERELFQKLLVRMHEYCCAEGKPMACDRPFTIETVYDYQQA
jgi:DNA-binding MarR family transcriptional regulator